MADRPLLVFPAGARTSHAKLTSGPGSDFSWPGRIRQIGRVDSIFARLNNAFDRHNAVIAETPDGLVPELVLVFETRGSIPDFFKAVKEVPELKWLGEYEEDFSANNDFYFTDPNKLLQGKVYFMLADSMAIRELRSLWSTWKSNRSTFKTGLKKWNTLFKNLVDIRFWGVKDRMEETGIMADIRQRVEANAEIMPFEIELWFRKSNNQRIYNKERIKTVLEKYGGVILNECVIEEISYHGLVARAPIGIFDSLTEDTNITFFKSSDIMHLKPLGQTVWKSEESTETMLSSDNINPPQELSAPLIALLDGMPIQNHSFLRDRLDVNDPDRFEENYPAVKRYHATNMASIIIHGDIRAGNSPLKSRLLVRPVRKFNLSNDREYIPENFLIVDMLHRAIKEIVSGSGSDRAVAPTVKVINLSIGDGFKVFDHSISPLARLIDWLADKYNLLFIVSAGNVNDDLTFETGEVSFAEYLRNTENLEEECLKKFYEKNRNRKIISPAESINALTVGASHEDDPAPFQRSQLIELYKNPHLLSPISRMGMGFRKSIKPDILAKGGRILFRDIGNNTLRFSGQNALPPGIKAAAPGEGGTYTSFTKGTSNAAALVSNTAGKIFESFMDDETLKNNVTTDFFPVVTKALLVHSTSWNADAVNLINKAIPNAANNKDLVARFLGYGSLQPARILECTDKRVTLIGFNSIQPDRADLFQMPLPDGLSGTARWRKLTVTLAWMSPINPFNQKYRTHKLWFDFPGKDLDAKLKAERSFYDNDTVRRGTVQHEVFYSENVQAFADNSTLKIKVDCKIDAEKFDPVTTIKSRNEKPVKYGLIVTLEIDPQIQIDLYEYIRTKIRQIVRT